MGVSNARKHKVQRMSIVSITEAGMQVKNETTRDRSKFTCVSNKRLVWTLSARIDVLYPAIVH